MFKAGPDSVSFVQKAFNAAQVGIALQCIRP